MVEMYFRIDRAKRLVDLSGWKKSYRIPTQYNSATQSFAAACAADALKADLDIVYERLKNAFGFLRRDLSATGGDHGAGSIITPLLSYSVSVALNPEELDQVIWTRVVDSIKDLSAIQSRAFANVFDGVFDTLEFSLPGTVNINDFIDAVEAAQISVLKLEYDRDATYCNLLLQGEVGTITLKPDRLSIVHDGPKRAKELIESFNVLRKLASVHNVPQLLFALS